MVSEAACNNQERSRSSWTIYEDKVGHKCNYGINYDYTATPLLGANQFLSFVVEATFPNSSSNRIPCIVSEGPSRPLRLSSAAIFRKRERKKKGKKMTRRTRVNVLTDGRNGSIFVREKDKARDGTKERGANEDPY